LRSNVTGTITNDVRFNNLTSRLSAAAGTTLTLGGANLTTGIGAGATARFGTGGGDFGTIVLAPTVSANTHINTNLFIAGGTLRVGNLLATNIFAYSNATSVGISGILDINDISTQVAGLAGFGTVQTGTNAATNLTVVGGNFSGGIQGAGNLIVGA